MTVRNFSVALKSVSVMIAGLCTLPLAGCGVAQQAGAVALSPFTAASHSIAMDVQLVTRSISSMAAQTAQSSRQISTSVNSTAAAQRAASASYQPAQPVSYQPSRSTSSGKAAAKSPVSQKHRDAGLDILPAELLQRLSPDQIGLQRAAQEEAMTATVGETIFWHIDGREGSAVAESENMIGGFTCRTFTQTLALEDYFDQASIKACRTGSGNWTQSF